MIGIMLFIIGLFATVVNMSALTEAGLAQQSALAFEMYDLGEYQRADGLAALGWVGVILHPLNYALWLYIALKRWQKQKFGSWSAFVGAGVGLLITTVVMIVALGAHPEIVAWVERGAPMPTPTP